MVHPAAIHRANVWGFQTFSAFAARTRAEELAAIAN
jgi:hypothetical protein